ncbi:MAG TPA: lamin tail domain-containing protein, partial [Candidatus Dormibacteraeota bacterium]|nr:lamin tail domain-containing protein [Candidatus Dormibacteraeota bacterium]
MVINEVLTHAAPPLEDTIELRNTGTSPLNLGGWYVSNSQDHPRKYRIPNGTSIPAGGYLVINQSQFNTGPEAFGLDAVHGDEVWVVATDANGNLTGGRVGAAIGPTLNGVSVGRFPTSVGVDYPALTARSFGQPNGAPEVGPIVINEIHYNPPPGAGAEDEYVELLNVTAAPVSLFHATVPANTWKIAGGINFTFPQGVILPAGGFGLVVRFDPADAVTLGAFRSRQSVPVSVPIFGPFTGSLDNGGDDVELRRPDAPQPAGAPDAGYVPYVLVDQVNYGDKAPWPSGAVDGGGLSLQRKAPTLYGNEPLNWVAGLPSAGIANGPGVAVPPVVNTQPVGQTVHEGTSPALTVSVTGVGPLAYQWRRNQIPVPHATNASYALTFAVSEDTGTYDVIVSNPGGSTLSASAELRVVVPPLILGAPVNVQTRLGTTASFTVVARGDAPLTYRWQKNGVDLPGETNPSLVRTNIQLADEGTYEVTLVNGVGQASAAATLQVLINPTMLQNPLSQSVVIGSPITLSATFSGNPLPFTNEWRKISPLPLFTNVHIVQA